MYGALGSNECPDGSARITDLAQCLSAALAAGKEWEGMESQSGYPRGCYRYTGGGVKLNYDAAGGAAPNAQLLCAASTGT